MKTLYINAVDVLLFRDGKPFDFGISQKAKSVYPPAPTTVQGAIRSHYLVHKNVDLTQKAAIEALVGTDTDVLDLRIQGPFIAREREDGQIERLLRRPADSAPIDDTALQVLPSHLVHAGKSSLQRHALQPLGLHDFIPGKAIYGDWVTEQQFFDHYWQGKPFSAVATSALYTAEPRLGIQLDPRHKTTIDGQLYQVEFVKPQPDTGLMISIDGYPDWPDNGILKLGGESRGAYYRTIPYQPRYTAPKALGKRFKVYFATPTYFENGWQPSQWQNFFTAPVTLSRVALGGYETHAGFSKSSGKSRAGKRYVPAGSVYYFETTANDCQLNPNLEQQAITSAGAEIGFGQVFITEWE